MCARNVQTASTPLMAQGRESGVGHRRLSRGACARTHRQQAVPEALLAVAQNSRSSLHHPQVLLLYVPGMWLFQPGCLSETPSATTLVR